MDSFNGEIAAGHPQFPSGSKAATIETKAEQLQDVSYTLEDDKEIEKWLREHISSCWHSMGTCKMAALKDGGVVDPQLNVYGVKGLKVADLSITPGNVGANTCSTASKYILLPALIFANTMADSLCYSGYRRESRRHCHSGTRYLQVDI